MEGLRKKVRVIESSSLPEFFNPKKGLIYGIVEKGSTKRIFELTRVDFQLQPYNEIDVCNTLKIVYFRNFLRVKFIQIDTLKKLI